MIFVADGRTVVEVTEVETVVTLPVVCSSVTVADSIVLIEVSSSTGGFDGGGGGPLSLMSPTCGMVDLLGSTKNIVVFLSFSLEALPLPFRASSDPTPTFATDLINIVYYAESSNL